MDKQNDHVGLRLPENITKEDIDRKANEMGISRAAFINRAIELLLQFDGVSFAKIQAYANQEGFPVGILLQNTVIKDLAYKAAKADVWGPSVDLMFELSSKEDGFIVGDELFLTLYGMYKKDFIQEKIKLLLEEEVYDLLTDEEKAFMIEHRAGKAWLESDEYKVELAFQQRLKAKNESKNKPPKK